MRSIWRRPPPFYPVQSSSALQSCRFLARLPSSPQVSLSLILLPSATYLGSLQKSWKITKHPLLSKVGANMEA
ncbi:hypothetical protein CesoFtcFv8_010955 [Champsocephalus esox]|uniref:Uncharacterized protein n=1 Tax=Champsocephalus esox TaxID=159716 RepID=A0AAN8C1G3_9TELE|nr:hypothetical protein CesoFtcFv8_010955 [Champsocephalus esox]